MLKKTATILSVLALFTTACGGEEVDSQVTPELPSGAAIDVRNGEAVIIDGSELRNAYETTCVNVYCDGELAGQACGSDTTTIIRRAVALCGA
jgi:hypothetical protein